MEFISVSLEKTAFREQMKLHLHKDPPVRTEYRFYGFPEKIFMGLGGEPVKNPAQE
jgi:hypothetical protein